MEALSHSGHHSAISVGSPVTPILPARTPTVRHPNLSGVEVFTLPPNLQLSDSGRCPVPMPASLPRALSLERCPGPTKKDVSGADASRQWCQVGRADQVILFSVTPSMAPPYPQDKGLAPALPCDLAPASLSSLSPILSLLCTS